jgi:hypothetical protein
MRRVRVPRISRVAQLEASREATSRNPVAYGDASEVGAAEVQALRERRDGIGLVDVVAVVGVGAIDGKDSAVGGEVGGGHTLAGGGGGGGAGGGGGGGSGDNCGGWGLAVSDA